MPTRTPTPTFLNLGIALSGIIFTGLILAGCTVPGSAPTSTSTVAPTVTAPVPTITSILTETEAKKIASKSSSACGIAGTIGATETYNPNSQTWWFTLDPFHPKDGCKPACVVSAQGQAEVNWRCTGLQPVR